MDVVTLYLFVSQANLQVSNLVELHANQDLVRTSLHYIFHNNVRNTSKHRQLYI